MFLTVIIFLSLAMYLNNIFTPILVFAHSGDTTKFGEHKNTKTEKTHKHSKPKNTCKKNKH